MKIYTFIAAAVVALAAHAVDPVSVDPANNTEVSEIPSVTITYAAGSSVEIIDTSLVEFSSETAPVPFSVSIHPRKANIVSIDLDQTITAPGSYYFFAAAGAFRINGEASSELDYVFTVTNSTSGGDNPTPDPDVIDPLKVISITPAPGKVPYLSEWQLKFDCEFSLANRSARYSLTCDNPDVSIPTLQSYSVYIMLPDEMQLTTPGTYTLTIPAGRFMVGPEEVAVPNPEMNFIYIIEAGAEDPYKPYDGKLEVSPTPGADDLESISRFTLSFDDNVTVVDKTMVKLTGPRGVEELSNSVSDNTLTLTTASTFTAFGEYTLSIAAEALLIGEKKNPAYTFKYTIPNPNGTGWEGNYSLDPADEAVVETLKHITITFDGATSVAVSDVATPEMFPAVIDSDMNVITRGSAFASGNKLEITLFNEVSSAGYYAFVISKDFFKVDGKSPETDFMAMYEVTGKPVAKYTFTTSPAPGETLGYADPVRITFAGEGLVSVANDEWAFSTPRLSSAVDSYCPTLQITRIDELTFEWTHTYPLEADGEYILSVPAKYFTFTYSDGTEASNEAFSISLLVKEFAQDIPVAETIILNEDFNADYTATVAYFIDGDQLTPHSSIAGIFYSSAAQKYMPWWVARDTDTAKDRYFASHSYYTEPGRSDDWLIFKQIEIPTTGFVLSFGAQSLPIRDYANLSDLQIFVTEDLINPEAMPSTPTFICEQVPYGNSVDDVEGDWMNYSFPLDAFAGKTVYINFVNRNFDKDILCIDNVKVSRKDMASIVMEQLPEMTAAESVHAKLTVTATDPAGISKYSVRLLVNQKVQGVWSGDAIASGESIDCAADVKLAADGATDIRFEFSCKGMEWPMVASQSVFRMAFEPVHRVMVEETTSLYCGNCPMAMYVFEEILQDENIGDRFLPVSVHIAAMGFDPMATPDYYNNLPNRSQAPLVFTDRATDYDGFIPAYDLDYDPTNENSFAYRIASRIAQPTFIDVDVRGEWVIQGNDTTAVRCHAMVRPAINLSDKDYRIAFILTENNVGLDMNPYWIQINYLHDAVGENRYGGWGDLGENVINARYHDVARAISAYDGHPNSLPATLTVGQEYTFDYELAIPETYNENGGRLLADHIQRQFCNLTAIVIDTATGRVINSARYPMSEVTENRYTIRQLVEAGIEQILADPTDNDSSAPEYFDLYGRRVLDPAPGLYIRRQGSHTSKILLP